MLPVSGAAGGFLFVYLFVHIFIYFAGAKLFFSRSTPWSQNAWVELSPHQDPLRQPRCRRRLGLSPRRTHFFCACVNPTLWGKQWSQSRLFLGWEGGLVPHFRVLNGELRPGCYSAPPANNTHRGDGQNLLWFLTSRVNLLLSLRIPSCLMFFFFFLTQINDFGDLEGLVWNGTCLAAETARWNNCSFSRWAWHSGEEKSGLIFICLPRHRPIHPRLRRRRMKTWPPKEQGGAVFFITAPVDHLSPGVCSVSCHRLQVVFFPEKQEAQSSGITYEGWAQQLTVWNVSEDSCNSSGGGEHRRRTWLEGRRQQEKKKERKGLKRNLHPRQEKKNLHTFNVKGSSGFLQHSFSALGWCELRL